MEMDPQDDNFENAGTTVPGTTDQNDDEFQNVNTQHRLKRKKTFFNSRNSTGGWCGKQCVNCFKRLFKLMYPIKMKEAKTPAGQYIRFLLRLACVMHCLFFSFSLAFVGFRPMIVNLLMAAWSYSAFLTLRQWVIVFHLIFLCIATCGGFRDLLYKESQESTQQIATIVLCVCYILMIYYLGRAYCVFVKRGGIKGRVEEDSDEENTGKKKRRYVKKVEQEDE